MAPKPFLRIRPHDKKTFGEGFGAATGVSDPRLQKIRIRNRCAGGDAATVAGYAGPGFYNWPSGHIPEDTAPKPLLRIRPLPKRCSARRSAPRPGSATHGYKRSESETTAQAGRRHCSRVRWPRFLQLALRPHPSRQWLRNRFFASGPMAKRRSERGSAPRPGSATHGYSRSESETTAQAGRRHCSRVRWPRFPHLALRPHP
jgi:hypothetical protein